MFSLMELYSAGRLHTYTRIHLDYISVPLLIFLITKYRVRVSTGILNVYHKIISDTSTVSLEYIIC